MPRVASKTLKIARILAQTTRSLARVKALEAVGKLTFANANELCRDYSRKALATLGVEIEVEGEASQEPCLFLGNHMSYLDILAIYTLVPVVFVAKKEVASWPLWGTGATAVGTLFVERGSHKSNKTVASAIREGIIRDRKSVVVFPEGTSSIKGKKWKRGPLTIAREAGITVQAFRICYQPVRESAFIGDDDLMTHLWKLIGFPKIKISIKFFPPGRVEDPDNETRRLEALVNGSLAEKLREYGYSG